MREMARGFGLPVTIDRVPVPVLRASMHMGEEEAARVLRQKFLFETAEKTGANKIALGHTADDRAESVLLNIIRGAGIEGLGSIKPVRDNVVRPLIDTYRNEVEAYLRENALPFRIDESNQDITYTRNRVRHELIPSIERDYNPQVKSALVRLAEIAAAQNELIESLAVPALLEISSHGAIDPDAFLRVRRALQREILRSCIETLKGDLADVEFEQIERVIDALQAGGDFTITLPSGRIYAARKNNEFRIYPKEKSARVKPFDRPLCDPRVPVDLGDRTDNRGRSARQAANRLISRKRGLDRRRMRIRRYPRAKSPPPATESDRSA